MATKHSGYICHHAVHVVLCVAVVAQVYCHGLLHAVHGAAVDGECWHMWQQHVCMDRHHAYASKPDIAPVWYLSCRLNISTLMHPILPKHVCAALMTTACPPSFL